MRLRLILLVALLVLVLTGCSNVHEFPEHVRESFVSECYGPTVESRVVCDCSWEKMQQRYTFEELTLWEIELVDGEPEARSRLRGILAECLAEYHSGPERRG